MFFFFEIAGVLNIFSISNIPGLRSFLESTFIALILSVVSNVRGYSLHQRMLDLERRAKKWDGGPSGPGNKVS